MIYRRVIAVLSVIAGFVAEYLHLWKLGKVGALACSEGPTSCAGIMTSPYGSFMHWDVALIGTIGYALIFATAMIGGLDAFANRKWPTIVLMCLIWPAVVFTARLKYYEWFVMRGFCKWCFESALTITICAILVTLDWRRLRTATAEQSQ